MDKRDLLWGQKRPGIGRACKATDARCSCQESFPEQGLSVSPSDCVRKRETRRGPGSIERDKIKLFVETGEEDLENLW